MRAPAQLAAGARADAQAPADPAPTGATELRPQHIGELRTHQQPEKAALQRTDISGHTRLLADFRVLLAQMPGNRVLQDLGEGPVSR